jgi:hypothetical protein
MARSAAPAPGVFDGVRMRHVIVDHPVVSKLARRCDVDALLDGELVEPPDARRRVCKVTSSLTRLGRDGAIRNSSTTASPVRVDAGSWSVTPFAERRRNRVAGAGHSARSLACALVKSYLYEQRDQTLVGRVRGGRWTDRLRDIRRPVSVQRGGRSQDERRAMNPVAAVRFGVHLQSTFSRKPRDPRASNGTLLAASDLVISTF